MPTATPDIRRIDPPGRATRGASARAVSRAANDRVANDREAAGAGASTVETTFLGAVEVEGLDAFAACWVHAGEAAAMVRSLKYGRCSALVTAIATRMAAVAPEADMVTWAPCTPERRRRRGFDPAELLARALARRLGLPARGCLRRLDRQPQTARSLIGRLAGPDLTARKGRIGGRVLVVDDVCTTGSTLRAAAAALRSGGARSVAAAVATVSDKLPARRSSP